MTILRTPDTPKSIREALCRAQTAIGQTYTDDRVRRDIDLLGRLIDECDRLRPIGPDGKHDDRHTPECGCGIDPLGPIDMQCAGCLRPAHRGACIWQWWEGQIQRRRRR